MSLSIAYVSDQVLPRTATDTSQTMNMISALADAGARVELVVPARGPKGRPSANELAEHYQVRPSFQVTHAGHAMGGIRAFEKSAAATVGVRTAVRLRPDIVYSRNLPVVLSALRLTRRPVVYETYRPWPRQKRALRWLFGALASMHTRLRFVLHSQLAADSYREVGIPRAQILVAHNGWNPTQLTPRLDAAAARARVELPADAFIVLYAGSIAPRKGIDRLLALAQARPGIHLVLVGSRGDGPVERAARALSNVTVRPWSSPVALAPYLYAADVLAIPPTSGPLRDVGDTVLPIKTFQYMAAGRAILAPDGPDLAEVLRHDESALLVRPDDARASLAALDRLVADPELRARLGDAARASAEARTWARRAERVLAFVSRSR